MKRILALLAALLLAACSSQTAAPTSTPAGQTAPASADLGSPSASESAFASLPPTGLPSNAPTTPPTQLPTQAPTPNPTPTATPGPTFAQLIGQKLMVAMSGTTPSADLLARIKAGQVGGVILFGSNISTASQVSALTKKLRAAAAAGGQPPLLISTDQEGGSVKRIPWIPPTMSPPQMGASGSTSTAKSQGSATGSGLLGLGINNDLAPVADVPASTSSFMYQQGRTWSFSAATTESMADAFAKGLESAGVVPTMKHFPGLGYAVKNTDENVDTLTQTIAQLDPGLEPYQGGIAQGLPMIMLSNAWYTAWDPNNAAGWSHAIGTTLLRGQLGFRGVTITDSLNGIGSAMGVSPTTLAVRAAKAGTDMILLTGSEASTKAAYNTLLADAKNGVISRSTLLASYDRILALKAGL
ncbi:MAG TPA: glycoside hydrolase family 3 N-terminal domain-containing protein [Candidatus Limnocylindrales bacterium]|nr:glycoside hydrolase family 3 N-terminal domain-containing protein [Candidatus Limnocylindrales bacterium]